MTYDAIVVQGCHRTLRDVRREPVHRRSSHRRTTIELLLLNLSARERAISVHGVDIVPNMVTALAAAGLVVGVSLGTLGLPQLDPMWAIHELRIMGPLCGATRAVALASVGDLSGAWRFNPLGVVLVVGAWAALGRALVGHATGRWVTPVVPAHVVMPTTVGVLVLLTVRQQLRASYLLENVTLP